MSNPFFYDDRRGSPLGSRTRSLDSHVGNATLENILQRAVLSHGSTSAWSSSKLDSDRIRSTKPEAVTMWTVKLWLLW
jgi:hypothetical protein